MLLSVNIYLELELIRALSVVESVTRVVERCKCRLNVFIDEDEKIFEGLGELPQLVKNPRQGRCKACAVAFTKAIVSVVK